jgi:hypothetical protein
VKNDIALTLAMTALLFVLWRAGKALTTTRAILLSILMSMAMNVKFSALLLWPIVIVILGVRVLSPTPWPVMGRTLARIHQKLTVAILLLLIMAMTTAAGIWACYRFRFNPTYDPSLAISTHGEMSDSFVALAGFLLNHRLMPSAWVNGQIFDYTHTTTNFLLDGLKDRGWWYYFPLAMLFKTPVATLIVLALTAVIAINNRVRWRENGWTIACLLIPPLLFLVGATTSKMNIGVRHVLPVYPFLYLSAAVVLAPTLLQITGRKRWIATLLALGLACETALAWPNYIAFFNIAVDGWRGGIHLLGDSNLDWGQDLTTLARWQKDHGDAPLALAYFGSATPEFYHITYVPLPAWPPPVNLRVTHVLALSATGLQGIYSDDFVDYRQLEPTEVLGGTIYLYDLRPRR